MTNSLAGDHQAAVVDVDRGPAGGKSLDFLNFPTSLLYSKHCPKKIMKIRQLQLKNFPTLVKTLLKAPNLVIVPPPPFTM